MACCAYTATLLQYDLPKFTKPFLTGIDSLPQKYEPEIYFKFIKRFGTHYIIEANMGALYGQQSSVSSESWGKMEQQGVQINVAAGYSGETFFYFN